MADTTRVQLVAGPGPLEPGVSYTLTIATYTSISNIDPMLHFGILPPMGFDFAGTPMLSLFDAPTGPDELRMTFTPVPEPAAVLGLAAAGLVAGWAVRRRRAGRPAVA